MTFLLSGKHLGNFKVIAVYETMLALDSTEYKAPQFLYIPNPEAHPHSFDEYQMVYTIYEQNLSTKEAVMAWKIKLIPRI